jgi:hypothetical protein
VGAGAGDGEGTSGECAGVGDSGDVGVGAGDAGADEPSRA